MNELQVIEHQNQRVLTSQQLAESYGSDSKHINDNFQNNKGRYQEGKHYFELKGEELKALKASCKYRGTLNLHQYFISGQKRAHGFTLSRLTQIKLGKLMKL